MHTYNIHKMFLHVKDNVKKNVIITKLQSNKKKWMSLKQLNNLHNLHNIYTFSNIIYIIYIFLYTIMNLYIYVTLLP